MKKTYNLVVVSVPSQSTSIPLTENLTQPQSTAPTVLPSENFDSGKWFRKNKKMVIFLCFAVIVLYGLYYFFLKHGPEKDGKKIAITYCNCGKEKTKQQIKVYKNFIADFDSHKFTRRRLAQTALGTLLNPIYKSYQKCEDKVESDYTKYKERFVTDKEKVEKYEYAVNAQQQICNDEKETILSDLKVQFQSKINGIPDLESDINTILANKYGSKYRVIMDDDINWDKYDLENFVVPGRKKFEYYPYIVKGDFNGNGISDLAAIVKNTENNYTRLVIIWGGTNKIKFYDGQLCSAISFIPANEWKSHWEQGTVNLYADAILVECYEKSSWILYWDGYQIQQYWMSD